MPQILVKQISRQLARCPLAPLLLHCEHHLYASLPIPRSSVWQRLQVRAANAASGHPKYRTCPHLSAAKLSELFANAIHSDSRMAGFHLPNSRNSHQQTPQNPWLTYARAAARPFGTPDALSHRVSRKAHEASEREFQALTGSQIQLGSAYRTPKEEL